ncbi:ATP-dependent DNA helicase pif1 [Brachionus plicatilis]|uniref:ATP-dependent DNA helicase pif1 n=1 Tax=Brachionus plicatilis TaxID=10195 RepID=A0A3M7R0E3_BRAPC|nr:ATP-dependent DNA helicase pif1 [Brachionus plicatilis]
MQRFAYEIIYLHLTESKQLLMILFGTAGTGKSFTIFAISGILSSILKRCAPTAKAAFIKSGETIHIEKQTNQTNDIRQEKFIKLLPRCRNGENTLEDWQLFLENSVTSTNISKFPNSTGLFLENEKVDTYNHQKLAELNQPFMLIQAYKSNYKAKRLDFDQFFGLSNCVYLSTNSLVNLTTNIWTPKGLVNKPRQEEEKGLELLKQKTLEKFRDLITATIARLDIALLRSKSAKTN